MMYGQNAAFNIGRRKVAVPYLHTKMYNCWLHSGSRWRRQPYHFTSPTGIYCHSPNSLEKRRAILNFVSLHHNRNAMTCTRTYRKKPFLIHFFSYVKYIPLYSRGVQFVCFTLYSSL